jgi:hypothetical protein
LVAAITRTCQRRTDQSRQIYHRRVDGDGIRQISSVLDHLHHERLTPGHFEGVDRTLKGAQCQHFTDRYPVREREPRKRQRPHHRQSLGPHQHLATVQPIEQHAREGGQKKHRNLPDEAHRTQQQCGFREPVDQPRGRDARHPLADQRNTLATKKQPEVTVPQRPPRVEVIRACQCVIAS